MWPWHQATLLLPTFLLVVVFLTSSVSGQSKSTKTLIIAVEDPDVYRYLADLSASSSQYARVFPNSISQGIILNFTYLPLRGFLEDVSSAVTVQANLTQLRVTAIVSDYYISLAIASYSLGIPYFVIKKNVLSFPPSGTPNLFEIEIDNFHLSQVLYDLSIVYKRTTLAVVADGTPLSSQFLVNFGGRVFSVSSVNNKSTDSNLYDVFVKYNPNQLSSGMAWILLFDESNLPLMERTLSQASRAGMFVPKQYFFIPSLYDKQSYLTKFYRGDIEIYTYYLPCSGVCTPQHYKRQDLQHMFIQDCLNHFMYAYWVWPGLTARNANVTILDAILITPSLSNSLTGPFSYNPVSHIRAMVQIDVVRTNRSRPADRLFSLAGNWYDNPTVQPPYQPNYSDAEAISQSRIIFVAFDSEPYFYAYNSTTNTARGLGLEIIQKMQSQLDFEYKVVRAASQNEALQMLKNKSADVSLNFLDPTADRLVFADASIDMVQDGIQMLVRKVIHETNFFHVFHPFSFYVWMSIVIAIVLLSATLYICDKISPNTQGKPMYSPFESFFLVLSSFLMSKVETEPKKLSSRLFTLLLWFSTLMYMTTYLSNLVAFLIEPNEQYDFSSVGDLELISGYKWGFVRNSLVDTMVRTNWPRVYARAQQEWPAEMYLNTMQDAVAKVLADPNFILIASADALSFQKNKDCKLSVVGNIANSRYLTWLFRSDFRFKDDLDAQLTSRKDSDFATLRSKYFDLNRCYSGQADVENKVQLGFEYLCGIYALLGIGIALAFLQLLGRWLFHRVREYLRVRRMRNHYKLGHQYQAEVYRVEPEGAWVRINNQTEVHFMPNSCLYPNADEPSSNEKLKGQILQVQYIGVCPLSEARIFNRQQDKIDPILHVENSYSETNRSQEESA